MNCPFAKWIYFPLAALRVFNFAQNFAVTAICTRIVSFSLCRAIYDTQMCTFLCSDSKPFATFITCDMRKAAQWFIVCNSLRKCIELSAMKIVNLYVMNFRGVMFFHSNPFFLIRTPFALWKGEKNYMLLRVRRFTYIRVGTNVFLFWRAPPKTEANTSWL